MLPSVGTATLSWTHSQFVDCFGVVQRRGLQTSIYYVKYWSASYWSVTFHHTWFGSGPGEESGRYCSYWWSFVLTHKLLFWNWSQSLAVFLCRGNFPLCSHVYLFKHFSVQTESSRVMQVDCSRFRSAVWRLDPNERVEAALGDLYPKHMLCEGLREVGNHQSDPVLHTLQIQSARSSIEALLSVFVSSWGTLWLREPCVRADLQVFLQTLGAVKVRVQDLVKKHKNLKWYISFSPTSEIQIKSKYIFFW